MSSQETEPLECMEDHKGECEGAVEYRMALSASGRSFPRCEKHWAKRLEEQERIDKAYAPNSDVPPADFDPADAGERWDDEY